MGGGFVYRNGASAVRRCQGCPAFLGVRFFGFGFDFDLMIMLLERPRVKVSPECLIAALIPDGNRDSNSANCACTQQSLVIGGPVTVRTASRGGLE
jgi:hypothetical protein